MDTECQKSINESYSKWQRVKWFIESKYKHFIFPLKNWSLTRVYGKCRCGNWSSICTPFQASFREQKCYLCGEQILNWYEIRRARRVWYAPWLWGRKMIICHGVTLKGGCCSQSLPRELLGI